MVYSDDRITSFVIKTLNGKLNDNDKFYLAEWLENSVKNQDFFNRYCTKEYISAELEKIYDYDEEAGWQKFIDSNIFVPPIPKITKWQKWKQSIRKIFVSTNDSHLSFDEN